VNSELATKADDTSVVHLNGAETISGNKTFASAPTVPAPASAGQIANKAYVDQAITNVGAGSYLTTAGGTVSGPITLPGDTATMVAPATVLYNGLMANAPGFCNYTLVNAATMHCTIAYTYVTRISLAEVRTALPNSEYVTEPVGTLTDGGTCAIVSATTLDFYPQYVPPLKTLIVVSYRGRGRAVAEVLNTENIAALANEKDDGVRGELRMLEFPNARTQMDCENAALAILDDAGEAAWNGSYQVGSTFLPGGATDIFPGDAIVVQVPSPGADFEAIVRNVEIEMGDLAGDCGFYTIEFANDAAEPLAYEDAASAGVVPLQDVPARLAEVGDSYLVSLTQAQINDVTSTTVQIDAGMAPPSGCGIEVRAHDFGWGSANDRNLLGRFGSKTFTLPRLARSQKYFLRLYDSSSAARYSRYEPRCMWTIRYESRQQHEDKASGDGEIRWKRSIQCEGFSARGAGPTGRDAKLRRSAGSLVGQETASGEEAAVAEIRQPDVDRIGSAGSVYRCLRHTRRSEHGSSRFGA